MNITNIKEIDGLRLLMPDLRQDERGSFSRVFCQRELEAERVLFDVKQINNSYNQRARTFRGMHWLAGPSYEQKIVRVSKGGIWDIVLDLRRRSPTYLNHIKLVLTDQNRAALYIPSGCAHGFLTIEDNTEVLYFLSDFYKPENDRGVRYNDPAFKIELPFEPAVISPRDLSFPDYQV